MAVRAMVSPVSDRLTRIAVAPVVGLAAVWVAASMLIFQFGADKQ